MMAYAGYTRKPGIKRYLVALGLFVAGLLSKPMLVTLPFVMLLMDYWPLGRFPKMQQTRNSVRTGLYEFRQLVWEKTPFLILAGASSVVTYMVQRQGEAVASWAAYPLGLRVANALVSYIRYVGKMFWPQDLSIFYPHTGMPPLWQVIGAGIVILSISFLAIRLRFKCPYFLFGWLWYLGTLIPVIGLVQIGSQSMADRYTYVPLIGLFVAVAWGMHDISNKRRYGKVVVTIAGVLVLILLGSRTWAQVRYWRSSITLFEHALTVTKKNYLAHNNLGIAWVERGKFDKAIFHLSNAIAIKPDFVEAYNNLGVALANKGRMAEAVNQFAKALGIDSHSEEAHRNLGVALERQGRLDEAVKHYREAIRIKADSFEAHHNLGVVLASKGHIEAAIRHYSSALKANPRFAVARNSLGIAFVKKGRIEDAIAQFREAIRIDPGYENARNNLKRAVALRGN
jgi:Flp pilus assembly protein TadD